MPGFAEQKSGKQNGGSKKTGKAQSGDDRRAKGNSQSKGRGKKTPCESKEKSKKWLTAENTSVTLYMKDIKQPNRQEEKKMKTQDNIMKTLWDNQNAQGIAKLMQEVVLPAIANMPEDQQMEAMGTVRDAVSDIAEYEECRKYMTETIKGMREIYNELVEN